jgi:hypothetical protein
VTEKQQAELTRLMQRDWRWVQRCFPKTLTFKELSYCAGQVCRQSWKSLS